jgi:ATP/maltotriose-dependent transcriptional regulator MalT
MNHTGSVPDTPGHRYDWMAHAACRDQRDVFDTPKREHEARTICVARCPVRSQCLAYTKETERGLHRDDRGGVAAGLTYDERHRLDSTARRRKEDAPLIRFTGAERCGTHLALLRHLWLDEPIDPKCWSGEVYRDHENRNWRQRNTPQPEPAPETPAQETKPRTPREWCVYTLWSSGLSDPAIAHRMAISLDSVQQVRKRLGLLANLHVEQAS